MCAQRKQCGKIRGGGAPATKVGGDPPMCSSAAMVLRCPSARTRIPASTMIEYAGCANPRRWESASPTRRTQAPRGRPRPVDPRADQRRTPDLCERRRPVRPSSTRFRFLHKNSAETCDRARERRPQHRCGLDGRQMSLWTEFPSPQLSAELLAGSRGLCAREECEFQETAQPRRNLCSRT